MKHLMSTRSLAAIAFALVAVAAASTAQARSDVYFSIGVQVPGAYVHAAPVYVQPGHVYVRPAPVYVRPAPVYVQPLPFYGPVTGYYQRHDNGRHHGARNWQRRGPHGDRDRDGISNQWDRDRDGDGARNRYDRLPANPYHR
jgi:hypothetical protein